MYIQGIMLVYDITNEKSFDNIRNWIRNIEEVGVETGTASKWHFKAICLHRSHLSYHSYLISIVFPILLSTHLHVLEITRLIFVLDTFHVPFSQISPPVQNELDNFLHFVFSVLTLERFSSEPVVHLGIHEFSREILNLDDS